jgi:hypothetical protein
MCRVTVSPAAPDGMLPKMRTGLPYTRRIRVTPTLTLLETTYTVPSCEGFNRPWYEYEESMPNVYDHESPGLSIGEPNSPRSDTT